MSEYRQVLDSFALHTLMKNPDIPDYHLMVGSAEMMDSLPVMIYQDFVPAQYAPLVREMKDLSTEQIQEGFDSGQLTIDDFIDTTFFLGDALGGE